jgi:hypothetical protein
MASRLEKGASVKRLALFLVLLGPAALSACNPPSENKLEIVKRVSGDLTARNDAVRAELATLGDDGKAIRHVVHFAYPLDGANHSSRSKIVAELRARGFEVKDAAAANGLVFEHYRSVAGEEFDEFTAELKAWFRAAGWDYDGWECGIVKAKPN